MGFFVFFLGFVAIAAPLRADTDEMAERTFRPGYLSTATGEFEWVARTPPRYPWPVNVLSIGNTIASYQLYSSRRSEAYFHHGTDIRADAGTDVRASVGGKVINVQNYRPGDPAYWEVAILDKDGFIWQYHHIEQRSIPEAIKNAFRSGGSIADGTLIGKVYYWPVVSEGERYHHIHVNVIGKGKEFLNIFNFLTPLPDNSPPFVTEIGILQGKRKVSPTGVKGDYTVFAEVGDLILSKRYVVPPHVTAYELDGAMPVVAWDFDFLPGGSSEIKFVNDLFIPGLTCGNYSCRHPVMDLGFCPGGNRKFPQTAGTHNVKVLVTDSVGNQDYKTFEWTVAAP